MRAFPILLVLVAATASSATAPTPTANPMAFFEGRTESHGTAKIVFRSPIDFTVHSNGHVEAGGVLVLDQVIEQPGQPAEKREWRIRRSGPSSFDGNLSNAAGPVTGTVAGNVLHLKYRLVDHHLYADQEIDLQPDGKSAFNRIVLSRFGISLVTIEERIRKAG